MSSRPVAVLGAGGTMGGPMARNLSRAGIPVQAWNRTRRKLGDLEREPGVTVAESPARAAEGCKAVITMVSDADATLAVMDGPGGAAAAAPDGALWVQMGTIGVEGAARCAELAESEGLVLVDAPVLGTKQPAEEGELVVIASGPEAAREQLAPVFEAVGKRTIWVGEAGAGSRLKVALNAWIVSVVEGAAESLALAEGAGVDPRCVLEAVSGGPLDLPYLRLKARAMLERDFTPSFRLRLAAKDAALAVEAARAAGLDLPMLEAIRARMEEAARDHGDKDLSATYLASAPIS
jgi:3-hydroxyisobutyrate dehydrogenase